MLRRFVVSILVLAACVSAAPAMAAEQAPAQEAVIPDNALLMLQLRRPQEIVNRLFSPEIKELVTSLPQYQEALQQNETKQALNLLEYFEKRFKTDTPQLLDALLGGGITVAVCPNDTNLLIVDARNAQQLQEVHEFFRVLAGEQAEKQGLDDDGVRSAEYQGITGWKFGPNEVHAIIDNRVILSNKPAGLKAAIDLHVGLQRGSLAESSSYRSAIEAAPEDALLVAYANMGVLKQLPQFQQAFQEADNPLTALLAAPLQAAVREATWLAGAVELEDDAVRLRLISDGVADAADSPRGFATPKTPAGGAMPNLDVPRRIAAFSLYRDLYKFYSEKDTLFPERTSGLIFFENMMGIFFTGRDLTQEVLAESEPDVRVVVAGQQYDAQGAVPELQFPGFAVVVRLRDPKKFGPIVEEAWQKAVGLINFTRGQQALPGLIIDRPVHSDVKYTTASFSAAGEEDKERADVRFNFQPALAIQGNHLILSSTDQLTKDLIDTLAAEARQQVKPVAGEHTLGMLDGRQLLSVLTANRDALVRQNMIEEGNSREEAEQAIDMLFTVVRHIRHARIQASAEPNLSELVLEVGYELP